MKRPTHAALAVAWVFYCHIFPKGDNDAMQQFSIWFGACAFVASMVAGLVFRKLVIVHVIAIVLGLVFAIMKILYDPDPPALGGIIGFPLFFLLFARMANGIRSLTGRLMRSRESEPEG